MTGDTTGYAVDQDRQYRAAVARVDSDPDLDAYRDIIIESNWPEPEHFNWVATAEKTDILDWADTIRRGLDQLEPPTEYD